MTTLETIFIKRFCLPINTDVTLYEKGVANITNGLCGSYYHGCYIFYKGTTNLMKFPPNILSYGINIMGDTEGMVCGIHAEHDAIRKLRPLKYKKKLKNIDILVIRISKTNKFYLSKPCNRCICMMKTLPNKLGYNIKNVYYSTNNGTIIKTTLRKLETEEQYYTSFYKRDEYKCSNK
jgi:hypothetical protein